MIYVPADFYANVC